MLKYASLLGAANAASTITNVFCNGNDAITFDVNVDSGTSAPSLFKFGGCTSGNNVDKTSAVTVYGAGTDVHTVSFNPYDECHGATDANDATSFNVDMKVIMSFQENIGGDMIYTGAEEVTLACTFQNEYTASADLGVLTVAADTYVAVDSVAFGIEIEMNRWNYDENSGSFVSIATDDVVAYSEIFFKVEGNTAFKQTAFNLRVFNIELEKVNGDGSVGASLTLFDHANGNACNMMNALDFGWQTFDNQKEQIFSHKAIFLDNDTNADYRVSVKAKACASGANSSECTTSADC